MFQTPVTGHFDMSCAAWTGYSNFSNNGTNFIGNFKINGVDTDWEGTYQFVPDGNKINVVTSYIYVESTEYELYASKQDILHVIFHLKLIL